MSSPNGNFRYCAMPLLILAVLMTSTAAGVSWQVDLGNWSTAINWGLGEPTALVDANIDNGGTAQIDQPLEACYNLYLGYGLADSGNLTISGGDLTVGWDEYIGFAGTGSVVQSAGINSIFNYLVLGEDNFANGTYELSGTGQLSAVREYVGADGVGTFLQTGGTNTVSGSLRVGNDGEGTYELSEPDPLVPAQLLANREYVGNFGIGTFRQTGGTNTIDTSLRIGYEAGSLGTYELSGDGLLTVNGVTVGNLGIGTFTQTGGTSELNNGLTLGAEGGSDGTYTLSAGQLATQRQSVGISGVAHFYHTGGTNTSSTKITLAGSASGQGTYELGGTGQLSASELHVGERGLGTFTHTSGTNNVGLDAAEFSGLYVGTDAIGEGTYHLGGDAALSTLYEYVGNKGMGTFMQDGGTNTIGLRLYLGREDSGQGTYQLDGGQLTVVRAYIGYDGTGAFTQTGGANTLSGSLRLGQKVTGTGTYELSGTGQLTANREYVGYNGTSTFTQVSGTNTIHEDLILGYLAGSQGTYEMLGGTLATSVAGKVYVGVEQPLLLDPGGTGRFVKAGGTANVAEFNVGAQGTYHARLSQDFAPIVAGQVVLDFGSSLELDAVGPLGDLAARQWGDQSIAVLTGTRAGTFTAVPPLGHLGRGVFLTDLGANLQPVTYQADAVVVDVFQAAPGDTDGNRKVEGPDILAILTASLFGDGEVLNPDGTYKAVWGTGDFDGNHKVEGPDILLLLQASLFGDGDYTNIVKSAGAGGQGEAELIVSAEGVVLDSHGATINGYVLTSKAGIFTGQSADNLGLFQADADSEISGTFAFALDGSHPLGDVIGREFDAVDLRNDLTLNYTIDGVPGLFTANIVVPEPATLMLLGTGLLSLLVFSIRRRQS